MQLRQLYKQDVNLIKLNVLWHDKNYALEGQIDSDKIADKVFLWREKF